MAEPTPVHVEYKTCGKCKQSKPVNEFYRDWRRGGYRSPCKLCLAVADGERKALRKQSMPLPPTVPAGHKKCARCKMLKLVSEFGRNGRTGAYNSYCTLCTRDANRESYRRRSDRDGRAKAPAPLAVSDGHKRCGECYQIKPVTDFYRRGNGYRRICKLCKITADRERRQDTEYREAWLARRAAHYRENREAILSAAIEARRNRTPEQIELDRQSRRAWYEANREVAYERAAQWRASNLDRHRENARNWAARHREANLEHVREVGRRAISRRRARLRNLPSEPYTVAQILERDGAACVLCGDELDLTASYPNPLAPTREHLECLSWPDATAGDVLSNVALSHWGCNNERSDKPHPAAARKRAELLSAERLT